MITSKEVKRFSCRRKDGEYHLWSFEERVEHLLQLHFVESKYYKWKVLQEVGGC